MKAQVRLALAQIAIESLDPTANLACVVTTCATLAREADRPDVVLFPELTNLGQVPSHDADFASRYLALAEDLSGSFVQTVADAAREGGFYVAVGVAERHPTISYTAFNSAVLISPDAHVVGVQRKLHPAGEERHYFAAGDEIVVTSTDLGVLSVQVCYDLYFPEVPRVAALKGSELLCGLFNVTDRPEWPDRLAQLAAVRAYENMQPVALVNRVGENHGRVFGGESVVVEPPGSIVARAPRSVETVLRAVVAAETLAGARGRRPVFADRRPELYAEVARRTTPQESNGD
ncbi:MAG: carbon-nitrogen hydrolase family protein [Acidimicrobiales bacterium]